MRPYDAETRQFLAWETGSLNLIGGEIPTRCWLSDRRPLNSDLMATFKQNELLYLTGKSDTVISNGECNIQTVIFNGECDTVIFNGEM